MCNPIFAGFGGKYSPLAFAILSTFFIDNAIADDVQANTVNKGKQFEFDASFLNVGKGTHVDLSRFNTGSSGMPGIYKTALYVNDKFISNNDILYKSRKDNSVYPCLNIETIKKIPFKYDETSLKLFSPNEKEGCHDIQKIISEAQVNYDSNEQRLDIAIPQIYLEKTAKGTVSPELWDSGVPAMLLGYNVNGYNSKSNGETFNSLFAGVNAGLNVGAWYLRHNGSYSKVENGEGGYNTINTYLQRDLPLLKARALIGQSNTTGELFDTLPFEGVQLATDERMLPESQRGYAPEIRGIARTNARVTVKQGEQVLYETSVPPGEFLIDDLYPTGYGGDLDVTIREADGSEQHFSVPYAAVTQLLRPGASRYAITAGELRSDSIRNSPALYQATYQRGLTNALTLYGGLQLSQDYYSLQFGTAFGTPIGAVSFDVTQARTHLGLNENLKGVYETDETSSGQSYRVSYSKLINETNSNISLAAYRFSTDGYMDFMTAMQTRDAVRSGYSPDSIWRAKNRMTLTYGQGLPDKWGQLYVTGSIEDYWNKDGTDEQYQFGYNNRYEKLSWGISVSRTFSNLGEQQTNYMLTMNMPLGREDQVNTPQLRTNFTHDSNGRSGEQVTVSGTGGDENQYNYGITGMHTNQGVGSSGTVNGSYRTQYSSLNAAYSKGDGYESSSAGMNGTIVAHSGGVTFSPYTSDTLALVEAKGAEGAKVSSYAGIHIDSNGYAVVPYLSPYQMNDVSIDPNGMSDQAELTSTSQKTAPYSGAVVKLKYDTKIGTAVLINSTWRGSPLPFGADVFDHNGNLVGTTGQGGQIYVRVADEQGALRVKWGGDETTGCSVGYKLIPVQKNQRNRQIQSFNSVCE